MHYSEVRAEQASLAYEKIDPWKFWNITKSRKVESLYNFFHAPSIIYSSSSVIISAEIPTIRKIIRRALFFPFNDFDFIRRDGLIMINTPDLFGIEYIYVTLKDEVGNLLESGYAMRTGVCSHWGYPFCVDLTVCTSVLVRAVAVDTLGE
jgi:hypothetical protein